MQQAGRATGSHAEQMTAEHQSMLSLLQADLKYRILHKM